MSRALALVDPSGASPQPVARAATPLLETKLYVPRSRVSVVRRPRLIEVLNQCSSEKVTIVVAPAGFGKTTLVAEWIAETRKGDIAAAWLSLDPGDNEPRRFWRYVVAALQRIHPDVGVEANAQLESPQHPPIDAALTALINDVEALGCELTLILDDYHVIESAEIHDAMAFLLERVPSRMHLVIASRSDPPLALARLRVRGELTELRADELRFTLDEAAAFLRGMSVDVSAGDMARLEARTEGWIAGLKLAALSMKGRDSSAFVDSFSGDNRYVADYLVEEVLRSEREPVRRFLLATALLDRFSAPLSEAVTGERDAQQLLEDLERRGLFVIALDDRREWYRYHHLFADVLQKQLRSRDPNGACVFHERASAWHEAHGSRGDAIRHALAAEDDERAAALLERTWPEKDRSYESRTWLDQVKSLPESVVRARPVLAMGYAWALLNNGELEPAELRLREVEASLGNSSDGRPIIGDEERFRPLPAELAAARVYLTQSLGSVPGTLEHAKRALDLIPLDDAVGRTTGTALVALALWGRGDLDAAHRVFSDALTMMRASGHELDAIRGTFVPGDIRAAQGRLREAARIYEQGLASAREVRSAAQETDELYLGLSELHREWNDLDAAIACLDAITRSASSALHMGNKMRWGTAMASVRMAQGDPNAALVLLDEAERHERRDPVPRARPIPAMRARIHIAQERLHEASDWASRVKVGVQDELSYLREYEHLTFARLLIARHAASGDDRVLRDALQLLERLRVAAQTGGRIGSVIEALTLESLVQQAMGSTRTALECLGQALSVAEAEGFQRVFLDHGMRMRDLLRHAVTRGLAGEYARRILAGFDVRVPASSAARTNRPGDVREAAVPALPVLTARELEILRLIAAGLRNQEIGDHLSISVATVKRHIANAYTKLGAGHRTEALARAKELKLL